MVQWSCKEGKPMTERDILYQLECIAGADVTALLGVENGALTVTDTENLDEKLRCAIASLEKGSGGIKVKFYDKLKALELLGKQLGLFEGKTSQRGPDNHLLEAIVAATKEGMELSDLPELQQAAEDRNDLVESTGLWQ